MKKKANLTSVQDPLLAPLLELGSFSDVLNTLHSASHVEIAGTGNALSKAFFLLSLLRGMKERKALWVGSSKNEILELSATIPLFVGDAPKLLFLEKDQRLRQRMVVQFLEWVRQPHSGVMLLIPDVLYSPLPLPRDLDGEMIRLFVGQDRQLFKLFDEFISRGYRLSEDKHVEEGTYISSGDIVTVFPIGWDFPLRISFFGETIDELYTVDQSSGKVVEKLTETAFYPMQFKQEKSFLMEHIPAELTMILDEVELNEFSALTLPFSPEERIEALRQRTHTMTLTSFPETEEDFVHLRYLSLLKYYTQGDFINDMKEKYLSGWSVVLYTKIPDEITTVLHDSQVETVSDWESFHKRAKQEKGAIIVMQAKEEDAMPRSFQNTEKKIAVITDRELYAQKKKKVIHGASAPVFQFLASLKPGDYVVHMEHGIGRFVGIEKKSIDHITREYLEIQYAENDKLFIPTDQADKITKFISNEDKPPKLTRLDSTEWSTITKKVKLETQKIAKELLELYAKRELAIGFQFGPDSDAQVQFEESFPYTPTPGQLKAIIDTKHDMEQPRAMDRLVCGDVGFGKTEVALRAAFKAVQNKKQVALISPITILADQHYKTFVKRMKQFGVRIEMLSRFRSAAEQKKILLSLAQGEVDIIIGTHRLLQSDVRFHDLGLVIIDEEQRFGVKQKEQLKEFRCNVDVLTLSATPIPRTLHMSLNNLRDITTITTPPPGRLPIITEVRKFSDGLIREAILRELERKGQVYFLHNKVRTIEAVAHKLRSLVPEARFVVAHGQMDPKDLEKRILSFKEQEFDVLVSSTIIENGIDLPNANTLIVNNADAFGLSQLYQLRGRVGRGKAQAYSYLLYSGRKLGIDAKKRLRAIVEASELGSGFQIAMRDLEIRGAGEILGASQHGAMNSVGVSHFIRMLQQAMEEYKAHGGAEGRDILPEEMKEHKEITVDLSLTAYIPDWYIPEYEEKISVYQRLSSIKHVDDVREAMEDLETEYGKIPEEVQHLFQVILLKIYAKRAHVESIRVFRQPFGLNEVNLQMGKGMKPENIFNLLSEQPKWFISGDKLKIKFEDLGVDWYDGLKKSIIALGQLPKVLKKQ